MTNDLADPGGDEKKIREASWCGSESNRRREQGTCLPPTRPQNSLTRFLVPAGTTVLVSRITPLKWRPHVMRTNLPFERYESRADGRYVFRHGGYFLSVRYHHLVIRRP